MNSSQSRESSARASKPALPPPVATEQAKPKLQMSALARAKAKRQKMLDAQMDYSQPNHTPASDSSAMDFIPTRAVSDHFANKVISESRAIWRPHDHSVASITTNTLKPASNPSASYNKNTQAGFEKTGKVSSGSSIGRPYSYADEDRGEKVDWVKRSELAFLAASREKTAGMLKGDHKSIDDDNPYSSRCSDDEDEEGEHLQPAKSIYSKSTQKTPPKNLSFLDVTRGRSSIDRDLQPILKKRLVRTNAPFTSAESKEMKRQGKKLVAQQISNDGSAMKVNDADGPEENSGGGNEEAPKREADVTMGEGHPWAWMKKE